MSKTEVLKWNAGIDWLTATMKAGATFQVEQLWRSAVDHTVKAIARPKEPRMTTWQGYAGLDFGGLFVGRREDGSIARAGSRDAAALFQVLPLKGINVTRLDVALTMWLAEDYQGYASDAVVGANAAREKLPKGRQRRLTYINGLGAGDTLYIGTRTSNSFGRLYDKWRKAKNDEYKFAWRAEVEYHAPDAFRAFRYFRETARPSFAMAETARWWFEQRGVDIPCEEFGADRFRPPVDPRTQDDERSLTWLSVQVSPTVQRLLASIGRSEVEYALGLRDSPE